jgi:Mycothiol maleylpyruvate isomerase N-terminal domain
VPERAAVLACFRDGVEGIVRMGTGLPAEAWATPVCGVWDATALTGHVLAVVRWYHQWLDRAEAGDADPPFPAKELATRNQAALVGLEPEDGPGRVACFREEALAYADRVGERWDLPYGFPMGTVTAGQHAGLAAMEWHAHAWDLAPAAEAEHRPADPDTLFDAVADAWPRRLGVVRRTAIRAAVPAVRVASRDKWDLLLRSTGRVATR